MPVPSAGGSKGESASPTFLLRPPLPDPPDPSLIMTPDPSLITTDGTVLDTVFHQQAEASVR